MKTHPVYQAVRDALDAHHVKILERFEEHEKKEWSLLGDVTTKIMSATQNIEKLRLDTEKKFFHRDIAIGILAVVTAIVVFKLFF